MTSDKLNPLEWRAASGLSLIFAMRMLGLFMIVPVFTLYGSQYQGYTPALAGLAIGAYGLTQALLQIPMGMWSDRAGRHLVISVGLLLFIAGSVVAAVSDHIYGVIAGRAMQGAGAIASAIMALAADVTREQQRTKVMAMIGGFIGLSFTLAITLGPYISAHWGITSVFWLTAAGGMLALAILWLWVPRVAFVAGEPVAQWHRVCQFVKAPQLMRLNAGVFVIHMSMTALFVSLPGQLELDKAAHWQLYLPVLAIAFVSMLPLMFWAIRRQQEKNALQLSAAFLIVALLMLWQNVNSLYGFALALWLFFVGFNYMEANLPALLSRQVLPFEKGSAMGLYSSSQFLGAFVGGSLAGELLQLGGPTAVYLAAAVAVAAWLWLATAMKIPPRSWQITRQLPATSEYMADKLVEEIQQLPGVLEATVLWQQQQAYLRVIKDKWNEQAFEQLLARYR